MDKKKQSAATNLAAGPETVMDVFRKSFQYKASWPDKEQFLDVIYWQRQFIGFVLGLLFGLLPLTGIIAIALFFIINAVMVYGYFSAFQQVDEDEFGGAVEILKEGLMTSFSTFLVTWIAAYSGIYNYE